VMRELGYGEEEIQRVVGGAAHAVGRGSAPRA